MKCKNLSTFKLHQRPTWMLFDRSPSRLRSIRYYSKSSVTQKETTNKLTESSDFKSSLSNEQVKKYLSLLPIRSRRLDQNEQERKSPEEIFLNSLDRTTRQHKRVGSTYSKARSPVYFPNVNIRLVRPSATDKGDPFTAIFRCDIRLTKPDIFNYLSRIYGLGITSIRTAIYRNKNRRRLKSKVRGGVVIDNKKGERTFKKVWIGLDKPFFFPSASRRNFLNENFNFGDLLNNFERAKLIQSQQSKSDPNQILPAGLQDKGARDNVFRTLLNQKQEIDLELKLHVKNSLASFTPSSVDHPSSVAHHSSDSVPSDTDSNSKTPKN